MLGSERAAYGEQIVVTLSRQLVVDYGRGYSEKNLRRMVQFSKTRLRLPCAFFENSMKELVQRNPALHFEQHFQRVSQLADHAYPGQYGPRQSCFKERSFWVVSNSKPLVRHHWQKDTKSDFFFAETLTFWRYLSY